MKSMNAQEQAYVHKGIYIFPCWTDMTKSIAINKQSKRILFGVEPGHVFRVWEGHTVYRGSRVWHLKTFSLPITKASYCQFLSDPET